MFDFDYIFSFISWIFLLHAHARLCTIHQCRPYPIRKPTTIVIIIWNETLNCSRAICISCQQVSYTVFDGVPVKLYRPRGDDLGPLPGMVYYHGGGCCMGSAGTNTSSCVVNCVCLLRFVGPTLQYNTIQCNAMQCNAMQCNARQRNSTQRNATQRNATQRNATQRNATQRNATQRNSTQLNSTQRNATQRNATQRNATQRNATQRNATSSSRLEDIRSAEL